jgi:hypothetical protein
MKIIYFTKRPMLCYPIIIPKTALGFIGMSGSTPFLPVFILS